MQLPFDRVIVQTSSGYEQLTVEQFSAIPLAQRVRALLEKRVSFFRGRDRIETQEALSALRRA